MSHKHINSTLQIRNTPVPADNYTYTYMDFNQNLLGSINRTAPHIYDGSWQEKEYLSELMVKGKHGNGLTLDEYAVNVIASSSLSSYTPYHDLSRVGNNITMVWAATNAYITIRGIEEPLIGKTLAIQGYMKRNGVPYYFNGNKISTYQQDCTLNSFDPVTGFFSVVQSYNVSSSWAFHAPITMVIGDTLTIDNFQVEVKSYNTLYTPSTRHSRFMRYPTPPSTKTISYWFKSNSNKLTNYALGGTPRFLHMQGMADGINTLDPMGNALYLSCVITPDQDPTFPQKDKVAIDVFYSTTHHVAYISEVNPLDGQWHFVCVENYGTFFRLHVDGYYSDTATPSMPYEIGSYLFMGNFGSNPGNQSADISNCTYDDLCIRTKTYDKDEVHAWYFSDRELYNPYDYSVIV